MVLATVVLITIRSTGHRQGYWSQTQVLATERGSSGTGHSGTEHKHGYWSQTRVLVTNTVNTGTGHRQWYGSQAGVLVTDKGTGHKQGSGGTGHR